MNFRRAFPGGEARFFCPSLMHLPPVILGALLVLLPACAPDLPPGDVPIPPEGSGAGDYVGLSKERAIARARAQGSAWRVVGEDGQAGAVTGDYRPERLNFTVEDGIVVGVTTG